MSMLIDLTITKTLLQLLFATNIAAITLSVSSIYSYHNIAENEISRHTNTEMTYQPGKNFWIKINDASIIYSVVLLFTTSEILVIIALALQALHRSIVAYIRLAAISYIAFVLGIFLLFFIYSYIQLKKHSIIKSEDNKYTIKYYNINKLETDDINKYAVP